MKKVLSKTSSAANVALVGSKVKKRLLLSLVTLLAAGQAVMAQGGARGIDAGTAELSSYIDPIGNLILVIGAVVGLVGGVRVYIKWSSGDNDVQKSVMGWMGSCVFLMSVGIIVKAFFGV